MSDYKKQVKSFVDWSEKATRKVVSGVPDLPKNGQKWLANNIWWLVLVGVALAVIGVISSINSLIYLAGLYEAYSVWGSYHTARYSMGGWWIVVSVIGIVLSVAVALIAAKAIQPLKRKQPHGWRLLFFSLLAGFAAAVIPAVLGFNIPYILTVVAVGLLLVLIGAYFLFQIKSYFDSTRKAAKKK